jgi:hypothetical protein
MRASIYNLVSLANQKDILCSEDPDRSKFELEKSQPVAKECLEWKEQFKLKTWHDTLGLWIEKNWPTFVPNDIPFL